MSVRWAALAALLAAACLDPAASPYERIDTTPPELLLDLGQPHLFGPDAGVPIVMAGETIELAFSEAMDPTSLRPGIAVRSNPDRNEVPLTILAPPAGSVPYTVHVASGDGTFVSGVYTMQLRTLLIDVAGNPLEAELTGFFRVP